MSSHEKNQTSRRGFLGSIATGAAAMSIATLSPLQQLHASPETSHIPNPDDPEKLFKDLNGKHRIVFDVVEPVMDDAICMAKSISCHKWTNRHT